MSDQFNQNTSNFLNCEYQPKWGKPVLNKKNQTVRRGHCRWPYLGVLERKTPLSVSFISTAVEHVLGSKGVNYNCPAWEGLEEKDAYTTS